MKKLALLLVVFAPALLLADLPGQEILPGVRLGMPRQQACDVLKAFRSHNAPLGMGVLRNRLINSDAFGAQKMAAVDKSVPFHFMVNYEGDTLNTLSLGTLFLPVNEYDSTVKTAWADLKDIADSKFRRASQSVPYPGLAAFDQDKKEIITDSWTASGLQIDLLVIGEKSPTSPMTYAAFLRITKPATTAAK